MSKDTPKKSSNGNPFRLRVHFNRDPIVNDVNKAPYFLADEHTMPKLERSQSPPSTKRSAELITANRPIRRRRKRKRCDLKAETPEIKQSPNSKSSLNTSNTSNPSNTSNVSNLSKLSITSNALHHPPSLPVPTHHDQPPPPPPRPQSHKSCKSQSSTFNQSNTDSNLLCPEKQNRYNMLFSDTEDEDKCLSTVSSSKSLSRASRPDHRPTKRRKLAHSNNVNPDSNTMNRVSSSSPHYRPLIYRRKKSLFRSTENSVVQSPSPSPSIDDSVSPEKPTKPSSVVLKSKVTSKRAQPSRPRRVLWKPMDIHPMESENRVTRSQRKQQKPQKRAQRPHSGSLKSSRARNVLNVNKTSSSKGKRRVSVARKQKTSRRQSTRNSRVSSSRTTGSSSSNSSSSSKVRKSKRVRAKRKYKITYIEDQDIMLSDDDEKYGPNSRPKSPGDMINGTHVHEYDMRTISKRTRKARRIQEQYNEQIQKEYAHLEKDTFIRNGKSVEVVCLD